MYFSPRSSQLFRSEFPAKARMTRWEQAAKGCILYVYIYMIIFICIYIILYICIYVCIWFFIYINIWLYDIIWLYMCYILLYYYVCACMCVCVYPIALSVWKHTLLPQLTVNWTKTEMYWVLSITFIIIQKHSYLYWAAMIGNNMKRYQASCVVCLTPHAAACIYSFLTPCRPNASQEGILSAHPSCFIMFHIP